MIGIKRVCGNDRRDNNNGNQRERGEKRTIKLYGVFVVKNAHGISGLLRKLIIFLFVECVDLSIVNRNGRKSVSISIMHGWGKKLSTVSVGFVIV